MLASEKPSSDTNGRIMDELRCGDVSFGLPPMESLRNAVSLFDSTLPNLNSEDPEVRMDAVLDAAKLLTAAKRVVLDA